MTIAELIDLEAMQHLSIHGSIKAMDPYAQHLLKNSDEPLLRYRRWWIRAEALRQYDESIREQPKMNDALKDEPWNKRSSFRRSAVIHPYLAEKMRRQHKASWSDPDFQRFVKRDAPQLYPEREAR